MAEIVEEVMDYTFNYRLYESFQKDQYSFWTCKVSLNVGVGQKPLV